MLKKILLSFFVFLQIFSVFVFFLPIKAEAQSHLDTNTWYNQDYFDWFDKTYDPSNEDEIFGERYTAAQVQWVIYSIFTFLWSNIGNGDLNWCIINSLNAANNDNGVFDSIQDYWDAAQACQVVAESVFETMKNALGLSLVIPDASDFGALSSSQNESWTKVFTDRPLSTYGYIKGVLSKLSPASEVNAQGFGYAALGTGLQTVWRLSRNTTYFLLILAIVVMAFMIMFRTKISPQTVITVQSALPKIVITLVLITFSYAIGGFLIDIMYVVLGILSAILTSGNILSGFTWNDMFQAFTQKSSVLLLFYYWLEFGIASIAAAFTFTGYGIGNIISLIIFVIIWIVLIIVLLIASFKIWWLLVKTFMSIILKICFSPFFLIGESFGLGGGFKGWAISLLSDLAVYPIMAVMFFIAVLFLTPALPNWFLDGWQIFDIPSDAIGNTVWDPPFTLGTGAVEIMFLFASLAVIMLIPKIADIIKSLMQGRPFGYGSAIGEAVAIPMNWGQSGAKQGVGWAIREVGTGQSPAAERIRGTRLGRALEKRGFGSWLADQGNRLQGRKV